MPRQAAWACSSCADAGEAKAVPAISKQLSGGGSYQQPQLAALGNGGATAQNIESLPLDRVQNFHAATRKQLDVDGQCGVNFFDQRQAAPEPLARARYFGAHHLDELWSGMAGSNDGFVHVETPQVL